MGQLAHGNPYPVENPSSKLNSVVLFYICIQFYVLFHSLTLLYTKAVHNK